MDDGPPPNVRSLLDRLRNHCSREGLDLSRAGRHMAVLVVVQMANGIVVKGGRGLEARYGLARTRASSDLDLARTAGLEEFLDALDDALATGWQGFQGRVRTRGEVNTPTPPHYRPFKLEVVLTYGGRTGLGTVEVEVMAEEVPALAHGELVTSADGAALFSAVGLVPPGPLNVLSLPMQIAQKIHACTLPAAELGGRPNERAHDLVDLQLAVSDLTDDELPRLCEAAERIFAARNRHSWPPTAVLHDGWEARYRTELATVAQGDLLPDAASAVAWLNAFVGRVVQSKPR
jgi:hypothetical protein